MSGQVNCTSLLHAETHLQTRAPREGWRTFDQRRAQSSAYARKVWVIAQRGYVLRTIWHRPGSQFGPVGVKVPRELGGTTKGQGGNKTQAVVVDLLEKLPPARYHVTLDNLFVSNTLMELLRKRGWGATGTCRTNAGVISELIDIKKNDKGPQELPWGTLISMPTTSGLVCQWAGRTTHLH